jgi:hypothetical protein
LGDKDATVTHETMALGGDTVGVRMVADWLGPKHPKGTAPESGVQKKLMDLLVTDPSESSEDKYIRGHLLNHNLGGRGNAKNMFPITGKANKGHLTSTETDIKTWVNDKKGWVRYEVKVQAISSKLDGGAKSPKNYVNATFVCEVELKDAAGKVSRHFTSRVPSVFGDASKEAKAKEVG